MRIAIVRSALMAALLAISLPVMAQQGPRGFTGARGPSGNATVGSVTTGDAGTNAIVTNSGTATNAVLNFTIPRGSQLFSSTGVPTTVGHNGDYYFRTDTGCFYGPKASGAWPGSCTSLVGPAGSNGSAGATGATGATGAAGASPTQANVLAVLQPGTNCNVDDAHFLSPKSGNCFPATGGVTGVVQPELGGTGVVAGKPLEYWYAALHNCSNQIVDVNVHGDSRAIADSTVTSPLTGIDATFANRWVNRMISMLQTRCGSHGTGVVPFRYGVSPAGSGFNLDYFSQTGSYTHTDTSVGPFFGSDSMTIDATSNGFTINYTAGMAFDHIRMYCDSGSALNPWTISIDGSSVGSCGVTSGSRRAAIGTSSAVTLGTHTVVLTCPTQPCAGYAVEGVAGTKGVSINNFSVGSAPAEIFAGTPSTQYAYENLIPDPIALDIIYMIANEPGQSVSTSTFQTTLGSMITHDRALTYPASVIIVAPLQDGISGQGPYYPFLQSVSAAQNTGYVDMRDRWGTSAGPAFLLSSDGIHENDIGNGEVLSTVLRSILDVDVSSYPIVPPAPASPTYATVGAGTATAKATFPGGLLFNSGVNAQTGASYTVVAGDENRVTTYSHSTAVAVALPAATTTGFTAGAYFTEVNIGVGTVTITPTTSTINGASSLVLATGQSARITSDGTNYAAELGAGAGGVTGVTPIVVTGGAVSCPTCGTGSGTNVDVNGGSTLGTANLNSTTPAAPSGKTNVVWQVSGTDVTAYVPTAVSGLVLLESHTASASTELDFTAWSSPSNYDNYVVEVEDMVFSTSLFPQVQFSTDGGATYDTGTNYSWHEWVDYQTTGAAASSGSGASATYIPFSDSNIVTASGSALNFTLKMYSPGSSHYKQLVMEGTDYGVISGFAVNRRVIGMYFSATPVTAFRIKASTGNFTSGTVRVYGIANH